MFLLSSDIKTAKYVMIKSCIMVSMVLILIQNMCHQNES